MEIILSHLAEKVDTVLSKLDHLAGNQSQADLSDTDTGEDKDSDLLMAEMQDFKHSVILQLAEISMNMMGQPPVNQRNFSIFSTGSAFLSLKKTIRFSVILIAVVAILWLVGDYYSKYGNRKNEEYSAYKTVHMVLSAKELSEADKTYIKDTYSAFIAGDTLLESAYGKLKIEIDKQRKKIELENELKNLK